MIDVGGGDMNGTSSLATSGCHGLDDLLEEMIGEKFLLWGQPLLVGNNIHYLG